MKTLADSNKDTRRAVKDPVCGMEVVPGKTKLVAIYQGHSYWFCSRGCRETFETHPQKYLGNKDYRHKGWWRRLF
ncbi:MAG: YHS domain-containing protein [Deltaproteobacteria bacterium]|nr:YHS domain-containing protein [Deltaproteobacteria bacterium]